MQLILLLTCLLLPIEEKIPEGPFCYPGKTEREILTLDPESSPLLNQHYETLYQRLSDPLTEKDLLLEVGHYIREEIFDPRLCTPQNLQAFLKGSDKKEIPLETFVEMRAGICRHIALVTTYFLDKLIKEGKLEGEAFLIRDDLPSGRHAWCLLLTKEGAWHIDPHWNLLENGKTEQGFFRLSQIYSRRVMLRQKARWTE